MGVILLPSFGKQSQLLLQPTEVELRLQVTVKLANTIKIGFDKIETDLVVTLYDTI